MTHASSRLALLDSLKSSIETIEKGSRPSSALPKRVSSTQPSIDVSRAALGLEGADEKKAYQKILRILGYRDRTSFELRSKLHDDGYAPESIEAALNHARSLGIINDERFCQNYIESAFRNGKGYRMVLKELKRKGIGEQEALIQIERSSFSEGDECQRALEFLEKHPPRGKNIRDGAFRKLISKGYSVDASSKAAAQFSEGNT